MRHRTEDGFALVGTLWFLALLGLAAVIIESWVSAALDRAISLQDRVASRAALTSATERALFLLENGTASPRGIELIPPAPTSDSAHGSGSSVPSNPYFVALDGRPYRLGDVTLRLQDEAGLYDLDRPSRDSMLALLHSYGVLTAVAERMSAAFGGYTQKSTDITARANADAAYARAGLPLPRRAPLLTPWELYRVLGWPQAEALWRGPSSLPDIVTTGPTAGLNINAAPPKVLGALTGIDQQQAARVAEQRLRSPLTDLHDLPAGISPREDQPLVTTPSDIVRLTLTAEGDPLTRTVSVQLTPGAPAPYRIRFAVDLPQSPAIGGPVPAPLPELPR